MHREAARDERRDQDEEQREALQPAEVVEERREVADPLPRGEAPAGDRVLPGAEDAEVAPRPARALEQEAGEIVGRSTLDEHLVVVPRLPTLRVHRDGGVEVLGDGVGEHSPDRFERAPAHDGRRAAPEHRVVPVLARRDDAVEERLFVALVLRVLDRVAVGEVVRRLDERDLLVVEVADGRVEDVRERDVVGVEHEDQLTVGHSERVVDVAGLGVRVVCG